MKLVLLIIASWATVYCTAAFLLGFDYDFKASAILAALCLACVFYLDHRTDERARAAHARDDWRGIEDEYETEALREID
jgi:hypothetical protein